MIAILIAEYGVYKVEEIKAAKEVLKQRGQFVSVEQLFFEKFDKEYDEDLIVILESKQEAYRDIEIEAIKEVLKQREFPTEEVGKALDIGVDKAASKGRMNPVTTFFLVVVYLFILFGRIATSRGDIWGTLGVALPIGIIFFLIAQRK